ncbi:biotin--[acetyl-CoA-carboxylase] ligase [Desertivibrio insolitus]|uniref:biotin--[acetyl-CoA-carboxylase] ligase n=1 Tax=Herbiconiux sp. SYSU D00978 TaxID=2812562 RepID=UPI001A963C41|nr:biotin--[acetyl-CoA-carboxylase] ligase [Herbiconiux sp. SYSU D00978]
MLTATHDLRRARAVAPRLVLLDEAGSTNTELVSRAADEPHFSVLATTNQTAGRGRLGRQWVAPAGASLAVSVLVRPGAESGEPFPAESLGWLPLAAGVAMLRAVEPLLPARNVHLKWPNDVLVEGEDGVERKVSGILSELASDGSVVIGAGVNLTLTRDQLPTPTSTSLALEGAHADNLLDRVLGAYLGELRELLSVLELSADSGELRDAVVGCCGTVGRDVYVDLPDGTRTHGRAVDVDRQGRLVLMTTDGSRLEVSAGDVTHLRYE